MADVAVNGEDLANLLIADLHHVYDQDNTFNPAEKKEAKFWESLEEDRSVKLKGRQFNFRIATHYGWGSGTPGEYSQWSEAGKAGSLEGNVTPTKIDSVIEMTLDAIERTGDGASYDSDLVDRKVKEAALVMALTTEFRALGPGTNQLALVRANTTALDTFFTAVNDPGIGGPQKLRVGMRLDIADAASGGVIQYERVIITDLDAVTGEVVTDTVMSLDAGWSVFQGGTYGQTTLTGLDLIVDNGDVDPTIFGLTRADSEKLRATVIGSNDELIAYADEPIEEMLINLSQKAGYTPTYLLCNEGIARQNIRLSNKDTIYNVNVGDSSMPGVIRGGNHNKARFEWGDETIPFRVNKNVSPRVLYGIYAPSIAKAYLRRPDFFRGETGNGALPKLQIKPGDQNLTYILIGSMLQKAAMICKMLSANGKVLGFRDPLLGDDND